MPCDTIPGAYPQNSPPSTAAARVRTRCRDSTWYHAYGVRIRFSVRTTRKLTDAPSVSVTGVSSPPTTTIDVLTARLAPMGWFSSVVHHGLAPCVGEYAA